MLSERLMISMDIIPHKVLAKGEYTQEALLLHVPSLLLLERITYCGKYERHIDTTLISRQRV